MRQFIAVTLVQLTADSPVRTYTRPCLVPVDKILYVQELQVNDVDGNPECLAGARTAIEMSECYLYVTEDMKTLYSMLVTNPS